ncbi:PAS domain-containing sensor histidine kinase [Spirosoma rigui]|uniref:PAS domain-containing sensor histidine kinase n=1 Tax=Spirosoma rigui TaxID=564064 RepID=UPI0009B006CC|nr:HAMP domain-containing sensor histidine kinase [Spirosoma rigui]
MILTQKTIRDDLPYLQELFDFIPVPVVVATKDGNQMKHIFTNRKFTQVIGYSLSEIPTSVEWLEKAYPDSTYRKAVYEQWMAQANDSQQIGAHFIDPMRVSVRCKDGKDRWFDVEAGTWIDTFDIITFVDINDLTRQKQHLEQLNQVKSKLISIISHDFRSPLASLRSLIMLMEDGSLSTESLTGLLPSVNQQLNNVHNLLENLLMWASVQLDNQRPRAVAFSISDIIQLNVDLFAHQARHKEITLEIDDTVPGKVLADPTLISLVVRNLLSNAIKFTPAQGRITIYTVAVDGVAVVTVQDTGVGMSPQTVDKLRTRELLHTQLGTNNEKGTGLGLPFCLDIIESCGGEFSISSVEGKGSTFTFTIALAN